MRIIAKRVFLISIMPIYSGHQKSGDKVTETVQFFVVITYICVLELAKIMINVNDFNIMLNCTHMHSRHAEGIVEYILCMMFLKFQKHI